MFNSQARQTATGVNPVKSSSAPSLGPVILCSAAAAASNGASGLDVYEHVSAWNTAPLCGEELRAAKFSMTAIPSGLVRSMNARGRGSNSHKVGKALSRFYNEVASRPIPRNGISLQQSITLEMMYTSASVLTTNTSGLHVGYGLAVAISSFSGAINLLATFDQYKIDQLEVWIDPHAAMGTTAFGTIVSAIDLDDATSPSQIANVQDHPQALSGTGGAGHYHKWRPHMAVAVYSGTFTSFANEAAGWIDAASPNVQHYGLKVSTLNFSTAVPLDVTIRAVITLRCPVIV